MFFVNNVGRVANLCDGFFREVIASEVKLENFQDLHQVWSSPSPTNLDTWIFFQVSGRGGERLLSAERETEKFFLV